MAKMHVFSEKQKHIPTQVCYMHECCSNKMVELRPIGTRFEVANIGTKALPEPVFVMLRNALLGIITFRQKLKKMRTHIYMDLSCWGVHLRSRSFHYHNHLFPLLVVVL